MSQLRVTPRGARARTIGAIVVHAGAGDSYLSPSLADITIPFVSGYDRVWTTTGIVAGWMLIVLGLSYYARGRIGVARWRSLHYHRALAWLLGVSTGCSRGPTLGTAWFLISTLAVVLPAGAADRAARRAPSRAAVVSREAVERFACFGGTCEVRVAGDDGRAAAVAARERLLEWHDRFSRFTAESELSRLNADPRAEVPASDALLALVDAIAAAGERIGGLVDGTLTREIAAAGYDRGMPRVGGRGTLALRLAPRRRRPAGP